MTKIMRVFSRPFSFLSALILAGCFTMGTVVAAPIAEKDLPKNVLTGETLFQIMASEIALQRNDPSTAYQTYMEVARKTKDPRIAQRAFQIADAAHAFHEAKLASDLWVSFSPKGYEDANFSALLARLRTGDLSNKNKNDALNWLKKEKDRKVRLTKFEGIALQAELGTADSKNVLDFILPLAATCENRGQAALSLSKLYRRLGDKKQSLHFAKIAQQDLPDSSSAVLEYADALIVDNAAQAVKLLERFTQKHPENMDVHLGLAKAYARTKNVEGVKKELPLLEPYSKRSAALSFSLASISDAVALDAETKRYLLTFERLATEHSVMAERLPQAYFSLGLLDLRLKEYGSAVDWFKKVPTNDEFYVRARMLEARALEQSGKVDDALDVLENTKASKNAKAELLQAQAHIYHKQKDFKKAYKKLKESLALLPENPELLSQAAYMATELKRNDEAEELLRKAIKNSPKRADFFNSLGYLLIDKKGGLEEAGELLKQAIEMEPESVAIQDSIGWYYFKVQNYESAKLYLEKAAAGSQDEEILMHLGELYHATGEVKKLQGVITKLKQQKELEPATKRFLKQFDTRH